MCLSVQKNGRRTIPTDQILMEIGDNNNYGKPKNWLDLDDTYVDFVFEIYIIVVLYTQMFDKSLSQYIF